MRNPKEKINEIKELIALAEKRELAFQQRRREDRVLWTHSDNARYNLLIGRHQDYYGLSITAMKEKFKKMFPETFYQNAFNPQTPEKLIEILSNNVQLIQSAKNQLAAKGLTLFDMCAKVQSPEAIRKMFMNEPLIAEIAKEGKKEQLIHLNADIYNRMWPDYSNARVDTKIITPEQLIFALSDNPNLIQSAKEQLAANGLNLFHMCAQVQNPAAVKSMLINEKLMNEIEKEGKKDLLIQMKATIYSIDSDNPEDNRTSFRK